MTTDSDNSDIDVCTVEEENCSHTGLTIVAAETYIESGTTDTIGNLYKFLYLLINTNY